MRDIEGKRGGRKKEKIKHKSWGERDGSSGWGYALTGLSHIYQEKRQPCGLTITCIGIEHAFVGDNFLQIMGEPWFYHPSPLFLCGGSSFG